MWKKARGRKRWKSDEAHVQIQSGLDWDTRVVFTMAKGTGKVNFHKYSNKNQLWPDITWFHQILEPKTVVGNSTLTFDLNDHTSFGLSAVSLAATDDTSFTLWQNVKYLILK